MRILKSAETKIRRLRRLASPVVWAGNSVHCPLCERSFRGFRTAGKRRSRRENAICPFCGARERDRLTFLFLAGPDGPTTGSPILHIAPEACLVPRLRELAAGDYVTADLIRTDVDERFDLMSIPHAEATFQGVYCSHVLQDVPDDIAAMAEVLRVLKPGGWAILNIPATAEVTVDHRDAPLHVRRPGDRRPHEHLRTYGRDFSKRMSSVGFRVRELLAGDLASPEEQYRFGIDSPAAGSVYFGVKPQRAQQ